MEWILDLIKNADWGQVIFTVFITLIGNSVFVKSYFDRKFNKQRMQHENDLASAKESFDLKFSKVKAKLDSGTYVSNLQYEREFSIYQELWDKQVDCIIYFSNFVDKFLYWLADTPKETTNIKNEVNKLEEILKEFHIKSLKVQPFYKEEIHKKIKNISDLGEEMHQKAKNYLRMADQEINNRKLIESSDIESSDKETHDKYFENHKNMVRYYDTEIRDIYKKMLNEQNEAIAEIRKYLNSLKV